MELYVIRHGESEANAGGYFAGWAQVSLTEKGRRVYEHYSNAVYKRLFEPIFRELGQMSPEQIESTLRIYRIINRSQEGD